MPSSATITSFYNFAALSGIKSAEVNTNFANYRGHIIPIDPNTATAATTATYDLGADDHTWNKLWVNNAILAEYDTTTSAPTPSSGYRSLFSTADDKIHTKDDAGNVNQLYPVIPGNLGVTSCSTDYTATSNDTFLNINVSGTVTVYLPGATNNSGLVVAYRKVGDTTTEAIIHGNGLTIDGVSTVSMFVHNQVTEFISDNLNWSIKNKYRGPNPTIQKFTSGSGTYTTPTGVKYIRVIMVGGGGGGAGSGTSSSSSNGSNGGDTTFGTSLLSAGGGTGANWGSAGGAGGAASLGTGPIGIAISGGGGGSSTFINASAIAVPGGNSGTNPLGGAGTTNYNAAGSAGATNSGAGGSGGGMNGTASSYSGGGGGAGAYLDAIIKSPSSSYSYSVGAGGAAGAAGAGTNAKAGGAGAAGIIIVYEYYQ